MYGEKLHSYGVTACGGAKAPLAPYSATYVITYNYDGSLTNMMYMYIIESSVVLVC